MKLIGEFIMFQQLLSHLNPQGIFTMIELVANNPKYMWAAVSLVAFIGMLFSFIKAHFDKDTEFDLIKLLVFDSNGKMSDSKARINGAFILTAWAFVYLTMNDKLTEWYVGVFLTAWVLDRRDSRLKKTQAPQDQNKEPQNE